MYCEKCGKLNNESAKFCAACGAEIAAPQRSPLSSGTKAPSSPKTKNKTLLKTLIIAGGGLLVAAVVILVLVFTVWASPLVGTWHWSAMKTHKPGDGWDIRITAASFEPDSMIDIALTSDGLKKQNKYKIRIVNDNLIELKKDGSNKPIILGYILKGDTLKIINYKGDPLTFTKK